MDIISRNVSKALHTVIQNYGLTIKEAAERVEVRPEHLSKYVNGKLSISFERGYILAVRLDETGRLGSEFTRIFRLQLFFELGSPECQYFH